MIINPAIAGIVIKNKSLREKENVSLSPVISPIEACREREGSKATAIAMAKRPIGRWVSRHP
jgi:hypothetical protein